MKPEKLRRAANTRAYALGTPQGNGFHVRRIVWGKLMASVERRPDEEIRNAAIFVKGRPVRGIKL